MGADITSRQNPVIQRMRRLLRDRSARAETGLFAAEGTKLLEEAARWCKGLDTVLYASGTTLLPLPESVTVWELPPELLSYVSTQEAPQGVVFSCRIPRTEDRPLSPGTLILDGIQDPGNVGTILRTADALGVRVLLTDGCADPYSPKTVRASMGAVFRTVPAFRSKADLLADCAAGGHGPVGGRGRSSAGSPGGLCRGHRLRGPGRLPRVPGGGKENAHHSHAAEL